MVRVTLLSVSNNLIICKQVTWPASSIFCFMKLQKTPRSALMSKEALERLFSPKSSRMNDHMENLQFAGQRMQTGFHQIDNLAVDLEVGGLTGFWKN